MTLAPLFILACGLAWAGEPPLKLLSYNVAGLPLVHPKLGARLEAIGRRLAQEGYDVAALQEVWFDSDAEKLAKASGLPYRARSKQAWPFGDGLLILSRHPIREVKRIAFADRTRRPLAFDGEQLAHKGALLARIEAPGGEVDVYDVHFVADYKKYGNPEVRRSQVRQLVPWIKLESAGRPVVVAGDLNMTKDDPLFGELAQSLGLKDACVLSSCDGSRGAARIDFILMPERGGVADSAVAMEGRLDLGGKAYPLSDHLGIAASLRLPLPASGPAEAAAAGAKASLEVPSAGLRQ